MVTLNSKIMWTISKSINFLSIMSILFIFLFSIIDNDIIITTVESSIKNPQTIINSNQSDSSLNFTTIQWKKFVNEIIGISLEYPSDWGVSYVLDNYFYIQPKHEAFSIDKYPIGTYFRYFDVGKSPYNDLEALNRVLAIEDLDRSDEDTDYEIIEKPNAEKYIIDGETAGAFSYKEISHLDYSPDEYSPDVIFNVEVINMIQDEKSIVFEFKYPSNKIDEKSITQIKDRMFNSIKWLFKEKNYEDTLSLGEQPDSINDKIYQSSNYDNESKVTPNSSQAISSINDTNSQIGG